ncbi:MAG: hypothetical protein NZL85_03125, partial [Fimbriimonadales bacterium]|nr:hypothetical protein [Fimbriimonadales bacterium]
MYTPNPTTTNDPPAASAGTVPVAQPMPTIGQARSLEDIHIDELLYIVVEKGASDLHLCPFVEPIIRVDGQLMRLNFEKANPSETQRLM